MIWKWVASIDLLGQKKTNSFEFIRQLKTMKLNEFRRQWTMAKEKTKRNVLKLMRIDFFPFLNKPKNSSKLVICSNEVEIHKHSKCDTTSDKNGQNLDATNLLVEIFIRKVFFSIKTRQWQPQVRFRFYFRNRQIVSLLFVSCLQLISDELCRRHHWYKIIGKSNSNCDLHRIFLSSEDKPKRFGWSLFFLKVIREKFDLVPSK